MFEVESDDTHYNVGTTEEFVGMADFSSTGNDQVRMNSINLACAIMNS